MSLLSWLGSLFGSPSRPMHSYVESGRLFRELDIPRTASDLSLASEGSRRGAQNQPAATDDGPDAVEQRVIALIEAEARRSHETLTDHLASYDQQLSALGVTARLGQVLNAPESARSEFRTQITTGRDSLFQLKREVADRDREVTRFRKDHNLTRLPRHPASRMWHFAVLCALVLVESLLNGVIFAQGNELGFLGGMSQALILASLNVATGFVLGAFVLPNVVHTSWWRKAIGIPLTLAFVALIPTFNLLAAHYRAAYSGPSPETAEQTALTSFLTSPFAINEVVGWLLFVVGVSFAFIAAFDGWRFDDPYPGYGDLARRRDELFDEYRLRKADLTEELSEARSDLFQKHNDMERELDLRIRQHGELQSARRRLLGLFGGQLDHLEQAANELLGVYRQANRTARSLPAPPHFALRWRLDRVAYPTPALPGDQDPRTSFDKLVESFAEVRKQIDLDYQSAIKEFDALSQVVASEPEEPA